MRELSYSQALSEGLIQAMENDESVFAMGVGVDDPKGIFGTTLGAFQRFGGKRVFDIPISENTITGVAIGSALSGMKPVMVHARSDFLLITMDQLINTASKWKYISGGHPVPITIRNIIGRGWGQGSQHSQSLQAAFAHFPGLRVVMPVTPHDAKGMLISSIKDENPVVFIEHRQLYNNTGDVPEEYYEEPIDTAIIRRPGKDITIVGTSIMVLEALKAAEILAQEGIDAEIIDLRSISPLDDNLIYRSVAKTGRLAIADTSWMNGNIGSEIISRVTRNSFGDLKSAPRVIASPDIPSPVSITLERLFYPGVDDIVIAAKAIMEGRNGKNISLDNRKQTIDEGFHGPF